MRAKTYIPFAWMLVLVLVVGLACSLPGMSSKEATPTAETPTDTPAATATTANTGAITNLDDLEKAVVKIEVEGSYRDPSEGWKTNVEGGGTGFIIDPSGIAVTNNHVVAGAARLKVYIAGESGPRSAIVLGVAECEDLAVIDIDGDGFRYLEWFSGDIKAAMDVYTAGFPISGAGIGYTLTKGIVSKPRGSVDWAVASVSNIVEHTARINPGNSGGPLVDGVAKVVGVNFGFNSTLDQNYAVARDLAIDVIGRLRTGQDISSLGINGVGVQGELQGNPVTGVWVRSVKSGSPAEMSGIQPGDIITEMEGTTLSDGTLGGYCSVVRSHSLTDAISFTVVRSDTLEIMKGQFNGQPLAFSSMLAGGTTTTTTGALGNPNATVSGEYFFSTEFENVDNWYIITVPKSDRYRAFSDNGVMYMEISPPKVTVYALYDLDLVPSDVRIDTEAQKVAGPNTNNISLVCRASNDGWYEFSMTSGGYWYIWLYRNGDYDLLSKGATTAIRMKNAVNQLTATCIGSQLTFYINGYEVGSATDRTFMGGGQVGVSIYSEYPDLGVEFNWFAATVP
ncbi:MAG: trypsin-like peptidase domain-containing protein [Chloroflexota bacterium]